MAEPSESGLWRALIKLNPVIRWWHWLYRQFSLTSVGTLVGVVFGAGLWIMHLNTRLVVIERIYIPAAGLNARVKSLETHATDQDKHITRIESNIDLKEIEDQRAAREAHKGKVKPR